MMGSTENPFYEAYVKTDEYSLILMYLSRVETVGRYYRALSEAWYNGKIDRRAILLFYAHADEYFQFARANIKEHLTTAQYVDLENHFKPSPRGSPAAQTVPRAREIYELLQAFGWKSGLLKLKGTRPMGDFGKARADLGLGYRKDRPGQEGAF